MRDNKNTSPDVVIKLQAKKILTDLKSVNCRQKQIYEI